MNASTDSTFSILLTGNSYPEPTPPIPPVVGNATTTKTIAGNGSQTLRCKLDVSNASNLAIQNEKIEVTVSDYSQLKNAVEVMNIHSGGSNLFRLMPGTYQPIVGQEGNANLVVTRTDGAHIKTFSSALNSRPILNVAIGFDGAKNVRVTNLLFERTATMSTSSSFARSLIYAPRAADVVVSQCLFRDATGFSNSNDQLLFLSLVAADTCEIHDCHFGPKNSHGHTVWIAEGAFFDHDDNPQTPTVLVPGENSHDIYDCDFVDLSPNGGNGGSAIAIGTSHQYAAGDCLIHDNYFENYLPVPKGVQIETEVVSSKIDGNRIYRNEFVNCSGSLTIRSGSGTAVVQNAFLYGVTGVRVFGQDHLV